MPKIIRNILSLSLSLLLILSGAGIVHAQDKVVDTILTILDLEKNTTIYSQSLTLTAQLTDTSYNPIEGQTIKITASSSQGNRYANGTTDSSGKAKITINNLYEGSNILWADHDADRVGTQGNYTDYQASKTSIYYVTVKDESEDPSKKTAVASELSKVTITNLSADDTSVVATVKATDENGNVPSGIKNKYKIHLFVSPSSFAASSWINDDSGVVTLKKLATRNKTNEVYARLYDEDSNLIAESEHYKFTTKTLQLEKTQLTSTPSIEDEATGTITVDGDYKQLNYYKTGGKEYSTESNVITGLEAGEYYVYAPGYYDVDGGVFYYDSSKRSIKVEERTLERYNVTLETDGHAYFWEGNSKYTTKKTFEVKEGNTLSYTVRANDDYTSGWINGDVSVEPEENANVSIEKVDATEWNVEVTDIKGDFTLKATGQQLKDYSVSLDEDLKDKVILNDGNTISKIREDKSKEISIKVSDEDYVLTDVRADNANVSYKAKDKTSGVITISELTGDVIITPVLEKVKEYSVTLDDEDGKVEWNVLSDTIKEGKSSTYTITLKDDRYLLDDVKVEGDADITYKNDEVTVKNIQSDITLKPVLTEKTYSISFDYATIAGKNVSTYASWENEDTVTVQATENSYEIKASIKDAYKKQYIIDEIQGAGDDASITYDEESGVVSIKDIKDDITLVLHTADKKYTVKTVEDERVKWSRTSVSVKYNATQSLTVKPVDDHYYVKDVVADKDVTLTFNDGTGEVVLENIEDDVTLTAIVEEKKEPVSLKVDYDFNKNGNYSEENPAIQVTFTVTVYDKDGNIVPKTTVYIKTDESEVSAIKRTTDLNGQATYSYSYGINRENNDVKADYLALFGLDSAFNTKVEQPLHLVLQLKKDLVLYENQIIATQKNAQNGKVINVPDNYEIWTGEVHQGALVIGSGEWISPTDNTFNNLSGGQHILRAGEYLDKENDTFYFASDYADFFVPVGEYEITVNVEASPHVSFPEGTYFIAGRTVVGDGANVYIYVEPDDGYYIKDFSLSKPNYVSSSSYHQDGGYILLEGVSGSLEVSVNADTYHIIEGDTSTWDKKDTNDLHFKSDGPYDLFTTVYVDDIEVDEDNYSSSEGSTNIELKSSYLSTLDSGDHTITISYKNNGKASGRFTVTDTPESEPEEEPDEETTDTVTNDEPGEETIEEEPVEEETAEEDVEEVVEDIEDEEDIDDETIEEEFVNDVKVDITDDEEKEITQKETAVKNTESVDTSDSTSLIGYVILLLLSILVIKRRIRA